MLTNEKPILVNISFTYYVSCSTELKTVENQYESCKFLNTHDLYIGYCLLITEIPWSQHLVFSSESQRGGIFFEKND